MKTYKLDPEGFKEIKAAALKRTISIGVIAASAGLYISTLNQSDEVSTLDTLPFVIPIVLFALILGLFKGLKRQKDQWNTYELTVDEDSVIRTQKNVATLKIHKNDLLEIEESPKGNLILKTDQKTKWINIPSSILEREELLDSIKAFGPIQQGKENKGKWTGLISLVTLGLMVIFFTNHEKSILIPSGIILILGLLGSFIGIQRSKNIDKKTKRAAYLIFLVLFSIVGRMISEFQVISN